MRIIRVQVTVRNTYHNTSATFLSSEMSEAYTGEMGYVVNRRQMQRIMRTLCGRTGCACGAHGPGVYEDDPSGDRWIIVLRWD